MNFYAVIEARKHQMTFDLITTAWAQAEKGSRSPAPIWPMLIAVFAVFYFFIISPQHKKQKETQSMLQNLAKGDRIVTIGGIVGTIVNIREKKTSSEGEDIVVLKVSDTTKLEMVRSSIARIVVKGTEDKQEKHEQGS